MWLWQSVQFFCLSRKKVLLVSPLWLLLWPRLSKLRLLTWMPSWIFRSWLSSSWVKNRKFLSYWVLPLVFSFLLECHCNGGGCNAATGRCAGNQGCAPGLISMLLLRKLCFYILCYMKIKDGWEKIVKGHAKKVFGESIVKKNADCAPMASPAIANVKIKIMIPE